MNKVLKYLQTKYLSRKDHITHGSIACAVKYSSIATVYNHPGDASSIYIGAHGRKLRASFIALLPIAIFLFLYLATGVIFSIFEGDVNGFSKVPTLLLLLFALGIAFMQNGKLDYKTKLNVVVRGMANKNIIQMIFIFLLSGIFIGASGDEGARSISNFLLSIIPSNFAPLAFFVATCLISLGMGTSVGTIMLMTPIAFTISEITGYYLEFCEAIVICGALFGDNLSVISDTTISACSGQNCKINLKFLDNLKIAAVPIILSVALIYYITSQETVPFIDTSGSNLLLAVPYLFVLLLGVLGINVFLMLLFGILCSAILKITLGISEPLSLLVEIQSGITSMFDVVMITFLVAAICSLIREYGGFKAVILKIYDLFSSRKGGQLAIVLLVAIMDIATANNTVAIIISNPVVKEIAIKYRIPRARVCSILAIVSCSMQSFLPYGAQMLVACIALTNLGASVNAFSFMPYLFYPLALLVSLFFFVICGKNFKINKSQS
ncbi:MAG: Na+/H+ antiporter NhaC family protein [Eggerthellaceae bacterium]|nr:Na+/H+ antiporter NhaC family protein [Eggerthellaceae bacterium]